MCVCVSERESRSKETKPLILLEGGGNMRAVTRHERGVWGIKEMSAALLKAGFVGGQTPSSSPPPVLRLPLILSCLSLAWF